MFMRYLERLRQHGRAASNDPDAARSFPEAPILFGIAAVFIAVWLLASGLPHFFGAPEPTSRSNSDAGVTK